MSADSVAPDRLPVLDGLRGLAALWVLLVHAWVGAGAPVLWFPLQTLVHAGWLGVDLFFVLSGFVLTYQQLVRPGESRRGYLIGRIARIAPAYYLQIVVFLLAATITMRWPAWVDATPGDVLAHGLLAYNLWPLAAPHLGPWWSLPVEFSFYLVLPALVPLLHRSNRLIAVVFGSAALALLWRSAVIASVEDVGARVAWAEHLPGRLPQFLLGVWMATRFAAGGGRPCAAVGWAMLIAGVCGLVLLSHSAGGAPPYIRETWPWMMAAAFPLLTAIAAGAIVAGALLLPRRRGVLVSSPMMALGNVSYGIYLWHYAVIGWWTRHHGLQSAHAEFGLFLGATLLATLGIAGASWWLVEKPVLAWSAKLRASLAQGPNDVRDQRPRQLRRTPRQDRHPRNQGRAHPRRR